MKIAINDGKKTYIFKIPNRSQSTICELVHKLCGALIGLNTNLFISCRYDFENSLDTHNIIMNHRKRGIWSLPKPRIEHYFDEIVGDEE